MILLITPKKHDLITAAAQYFFNQNSSLKAEIALSNYDVNTFSSKGKEDDKGVAAKVNYAMQHQVFGNIKPGIVLQTDVGYEFVQDKFKPLETLRNVEFNRDWSLPFDAPAATENLINASLQIKDFQNNYVKYQFTNYNRSDNLMELEIQLKMRWILKDGILIINSISRISIAMYKLALM